MTFLSNLVGNYVVYNVERMVDIKMFGSVMIFIIMLWFIFLARILILGAIFNATYQEMSLGKLEGRSGDMIAILKKHLGMIQIYLLHSLSKIVTLIDTKKIISRGGETIFLLHFYEDK